MFRPLSCAALATSCVPPSVLCSAPVCATQSSRNHRCCLESPGHSQPTRTAHAHRSALLLGPSRPLDTLAERGNDGPGPKECNNVIDLWTRRGSQTSAYSLGRSSLKNAALWGL